MSAKSSLVLPLLYLLIFAVVSLAAGGVYVLARWAAAFNPAFATQPGWFAAELPGAIASVLPASAVATVFLLFFRIMRHPGKRVLSFLLPLITASAVLFGAVYAAAVICGENGCPVRPPPNPVVPQTIHPAEPDPFYVGTVTPTAEGYGISPVIVAARGDEDQAPIAVLPPPGGEDALRHLRWYARGEVDPATGLISRDGGGTRNLRPSNPVYGRLFAPPRFLSAIIAEIDRFNSYLYSLERVGLEPLALAVFSIALFTMSSWWILRFSRWPLLNMVISLFLLRAVFLLLAALTSDLGVELARVLPDPRIAANLPTVVFLLLGTVFTLIDFLFVPYYGRKGR